MLSTNKNKKEISLSFFVILIGNIRKEDNFVFHYTKKYEKECIPKKLFLSIK